MIDHARPIAILATALALGGGSAMAQFGGLFDPPRPPSNVPVRPTQPPPPTQLAPAQPLLPPPGPPGRIQSEELPAPGAPPASPRAGNTAVTALPPGPPGPAPRGPRAATPVPPTAAALPAQPAALAPPPPPEDTPIPPPAQKITNPTAVFAGLDKITGRITAFDAAIGETVQFGALQVTARACYSRPPTETPLTDGFVEVDEVTLQGEVRRIFTGWMFAASPGLHAVEHAIYDVWLTDCKGGAPPVADIAPAPAPVAARPAAPQRQVPPQRQPAQRQTQPQVQAQPGGTWLQPGPAR